MGRNSLEHGVSREWWNGDMFPSLRKHSTTSGGGRSKHVYVVPRGSSLGSTTPLPDGAIGASYWGSIVSGGRRSRRWNVPVCH